MSSFVLDRNTRMGQQHVRMAVIGCGGTGSAFASGLPYLHQALRAQGHGGLDVLLLDGDRISDTNCVRQPFSRGEIGMHKSVVLASRLNQFWGLNWKGEPYYLDLEHRSRRFALPEYDIVVGCVDTRTSRKMIHDLVTLKSFMTGLWLDIGNDTDSGQFVLGQPLNGRNKPSAERLRTVAELYPEVIDFAEEQPGEPSCSALESLTKQQPFVNQVLAAQALALLGRLFWHGSIDYHGAFLNLATGKSTPLPIDPKQWQRLSRWNRKKAA
jgi:PRTRC genetic system ThiF family protein